MLLSPVSFYSFQMWLLENIELYMWLVFMGCILGTILSTKNMVECKTKFWLSGDLTFQCNVVITVNLKKIKISILFIICITSPFNRKKYHTTWVPELVTEITSVPGSCTESLRTHG